ncbi:MAG: NAD-dependent epimerase/dehydratase family protein [Rhizomicrobium sp.]
MPSSAETNLIIGGDGFVGRNLRAYFEARGMPFTAIMRADGDLRDRATVMGLFEKLPKVGRIFHLVTFQRTGQIQYAMPATLFDANLRIHTNVLEAWAAHQPQAKLISTGSSCTYPERDDPMDESVFGMGPLHESVRAYGLAKMALARGSEVYGTQYGLKWLHCVLATVYGPYDHLAADRSHFIGGMMGRAIQEQREGKTEFSVWGSPDAVRECLYVDDQIEAILAADAGFENSVLNCASNAPVSIGQVAEAILRVLAWDARIVYPEGSFQGTNRKVLDSGKFLARSGWAPRIGLDEGLGLLAEDLKHRV